MRSLWSACHPPRYTALTFDEYSLSQCALQHTLSMYPINTSYQHFRSIHLISIPHNFPSYANQTNLPLSHPTRHSIWQSKACRRCPPSQGLGSLRHQQQRQLRQVSSETHLKLPRIIVYIFIPPLSRMYLVNNQPWPWHVKPDHVKADEAVVVRVDRDRIATNERGHAKQSLHFISSCTSK